MFDLWDTKTDCYVKKDGLREVIPKKTWKDENDFTHFFFTKNMFKNPKYIIPKDPHELFNKLMEGGSREYPSDGGLPADLAAHEAKKVLSMVEKISKDPTHEYHDLACHEVEKNGLFGLVRGTIKLYLGHYTTKDWRRKRFTDDVDFWVLDKKLLEYILHEIGCSKNRKTLEYEKLINWTNLDTGERESTILIASNDVNQLLDFGGGSYLDGSTLKDIFKKKLKRGHDVDLNDIINVAAENYRQNTKRIKDWEDAWPAFEESANIRSSRITANMISLCRYSRGIADHFENVSKAIKLYNHEILDVSKYPDRKIINIFKKSSHHLDYWLTLNERDTRSKTYNNLFREKRRKSREFINLRAFSDEIIKLLNSKYTHLKIKIEVET